MSEPKRAPVYKVTGSVRVSRQQLDDALDLRAVLRNLTAPAPDAEAAKA